MNASDRYQCGMVKTAELDEWDCKMVAHWYPSVRAACGWCWVLDCTGKRLDSGVSIRIPVGEFRFQLQERESRWALQTISVLLLLPMHSQKQPSFELAFMTGIEAMVRDERRGVERQLLRARCHYIIRSYTIKHSINDHADRSTVKPSEMQINQRWIWNFQIRQLQSRHDFCNWILKQKYSKHPKKETF